VMSASEAFDTSSYTWTSLAPMATPRYGMAAVAVATYVYVIGGSSEPGLSSTDTFEAYLPPSGQDSSLVPIQTQ
jgi:hypothetical protein